MHNITGISSPINKHERRGNPKEGSEKILIGYKVKASFEQDNLKIEKTLNRKDRLAKQVQTSTLRWIFQIMEGIGIVNFYNESLSQIIREIITNINAARKKILYLFGKSAVKIYELIPQTCTKWVGM